MPDTLPSPSPDEAADSAPIRPRWDGWGGLYLGDRLLRTFRKPGCLEAVIFATFERLGWPPAIDNPLPCDPNESEETARERLRQTVRNLMRVIPKGTLGFRSDGQRVYWRLAN